MNILVFLLGAVFVVLAIVDILWTVFWVDGGAGPVASRIARGQWRVFSRLVGHERHAFLSLSGVLTIVSTLFSWVFLLWMGWVIAFSSDPSSLTSTSTTGVPTVVDRVYFVAYSLFTMGNGDFTPTGRLWKIMTSLLTGTGLLLITLLVTYSISVLSAAVMKRSVASEIMGLGRTPEDFLLSCWNGKDFKGCEIRIAQLAEELSKQAEQHLAYPVLAYNHAKSETRSLPMAVAVFDEALMILLFGIPAELSPSLPVLVSGRSSVSAFLSSLPSASEAVAAIDPPLPTFDKLHSVGIPAIDRLKLNAHVSASLERRRRLLQVIKDDAWIWPGSHEVERSSPTNEASLSPQW
jgi:hypothetical protein